ncbi:DUF222 domain-containing protein [Cryobacterium sp. TMT2-14]|uniref:DUF222 domain-containing protein n=1 Tax=Cryobacterium sp. TMT2-14 TaxID=1259245 RepID=UPI00106BAC94|nr:DUF222 domain-containing protein [Cryobacterium sp. TMT2-14]TFC34220.1 DUF222 domain-containing protein [Cryobacterium sp. TMT2-14]
MAATIARRSRPELGHSGLAAQQGFLSPEALIQNWTGSSNGDAYKLVAVGTMMADTEAADKLVEEALSTLSTPDADADADAVDVADAVGVAAFTARVPWQAPVARGVTAGTLSVDAAEAIRAGLGQIDAAVTAEKLRVALAALLTEAPSLNADEVFKRARRMRDRLDQAGITAREKQAHDDRYLKVYRLSNGNVRLNGLFAPEDGEFVLSTFDSITGLDRSPPHQRLAHSQRRHQPRRRSTALPPAPPTAAQPALEDHPHRNATLAAATGGERPGTDTDRTAEQAGGAVGRGSRPGS